MRALCRILKLSLLRACRGESGVAPQWHLPNRLAGYSALNELPGLFSPSTTRLALRRGVFLRSYAYDFIQKLVPGLTEERIGEAIRNEAAAREDFVI